MCVCVCVCVYFTTYLSIQLLTVPFLVGVLLLDPPWAFLMFLPAYLIGEMWIGVCYATVLDQVPHRLVSSAVVLWLFINNNIGGAVPLLVPVIEQYWELRYSLLVLFPGCYLMAAMFFTATLLTMCCRAVLKRRRNDFERKKLLPKQGCQHNEIVEYSSVNYGSTDHN